jgi:hypothetical protein
MVQQFGAKYLPSIGWLGPIKQGSARNQRGNQNNFKCCCCGKFHFVAKKFSTKMIYNG